MNWKKESKNFVLLIVGLFVFIFVIICLRGWGLLYKWPMFIFEEPITLLDCIMGTGLTIVFVCTLLWGAYPTLRELVQKDGKEVSTMKYADGTPMSPESQASIERGMEESMRGETNKYNWKEK